MTDQILSLSPETAKQILWVAGMFIIDYLAVVLAVIIDLRSGIVKARREGKPRTSGGYRRSVEKGLRYLMTLFALSVIDLVVIAAAMLFSVTMEWHVPVFPLFTSLGAVALALIEGKSVMENVQSRRDFTSAAEKAAEILSADEFRRLIDAIKSIKDL